MGILGKVLWGGGIKRELEWGEDVRGRVLDWELGYVFILILLLIV